MTDDVNAQANPSPEQADDLSYASFLGTEPSLDMEESTDPNPEPAVETETSEEADPNADAEHEAATTEEDDNWLPDEQEKTFPLETLAKYAKRFGYSLEEVQADPRLQRTLKDKLNSDIYIRQQQEAAQQADDEPTVEEPAEKPPADPTQAQAQYQQQIEAMVARVVNPERAKQAGLNLLAGFGVDINSQDPEVQALVQNAGKVGNTLATYGVDLVMSALPQLLPQMVEQTFPQFGQMYERALYANLWEGMRSQNPEFSNLPQYGTKEFNKELRAAAQQIPYFEQMRLPGNMIEQAQAKYTMLAKMMLGQKPSPAVVKQAVETGKKMERKSAQNVARGRALGAGSNSQQFRDGGEVDELDAMIAQHNGNLNPFGRK